MTYTELPLLLRKEFVLARNTRFYLLAGPSLWSHFQNFGLTYTMDGQQNEFGTTVEWLQKVLTSKTSPTDLVVNAGAGFNGVVGRHRLGLKPVTGMEPSELEVRTPVFTALFPFLLSIF